VLHPEAIVSVERDGHLRSNPHHSSPGYFLDRTLRALHWLATELTERIGQNPVNENLWVLGSLHPGDASEILVPVDDARTVLYWALSYSRLLKRVHRGDPPAFKALVAVVDPRTLQTTGSQVDGPAAVQPPHEAEALRALRSELLAIHTTLEAEARAALVDAVSGKATGPTPGGKYWPVSAATDWAINTRHALRDRYTGRRPPVLSTPAADVLARRKMDNTRVFGRYREERDLSWTLPPAQPCLPWHPHELFVERTLSTEISSSESNPVTELYGIADWCLLLRFVGEAIVLDTNNHYAKFFDPNTVSRNRRREAEMELETVVKEGKAVWKSVYTDARQLQRRYALWRETNDGRGLLPPSLGDTFTMARITRQLYRDWCADILRFRGQLDGWVFSDAVEDEQD
jgi:hypothetical protein